MYQIEADTCTNDCFTKLIDCVRTCPVILDSFLPVICDTSCKSECVSCVIHNVQIMRQGLANKCIVLETKYNIHKLKCIYFCV